MKRGNKMPNLADLMRGRIDELAKGPPTIPEGDYPAVIQKFELTEARNTEKSPILRLTVRLLDWPDDDSIEDTQKERIEDISKRTVACDFWFPLDYRYARLCQSCGIEGDITEQTNYELVGKHVTAQVKQQVSKRTKEVFSTAVSLTGSNSA
jgi:hypothetical protein